MASEPQQQQQQQEPSVEEAKRRAPPSVIVSDNPDLANAINLADRVRSRVSKYPHPVRTQPPLPHGFVEGALVGLASYMIFWPVRAQLMRWAGRSGQWWSQTKPYIGIFCTAGQTLVGAKAALYTAVLVGSKAWLETLGDFAAATSATGTHRHYQNTNTTTTTTNNNNNNNNSTNHYHKTLLARELCRDSIVAQTRQSDRYCSQHSEGDDDDGDGGASLADWLKDPEQVVVQELFRAVRHCQNSNDSEAPEINISIQADDKKL